METAMRISTVSTAGLLMLTLSRPSFAFPCPVDFIEAKIDSGNAFTTMLSERTYRFVPEDRSGSADVQSELRDPRPVWDDLPPYLTLGERVAICNDRELILLDDSQPHARVAIERVR
jgi:hypothetical protein